MKTRSIALVALVGTLAAVGCSIASPPETSESSDSEIRAMTAEEIVGEIAYGATLEVDYTPAPKYRAVSFQGERGDIISATVVSLDATDPILWLTDASFNTLTSNNDTRPTDLNSTINRTLQTTGKYFLVFREMNNAPKAKFNVSVKKTGALPPECDPDGEGFSDPACADPLGFDPFDANSCSGPAMTTAEATAKFTPPAGTPLNLTGRFYYRSRQCTVPAEGAAAACSPWVRSFLMDIPVSRATAPTATAPNFAFMASATSRPKVKVEFGTEPTSLKQFCVDGPFSALRNESWFGADDSIPTAPTICGIKTATPPALTATCARFEPETIQINSGDPAQYTEYSTVMMARY